MAGVAVFKLKHIGINKQLAIPVVITSFETTAKPNWASSQVYGRMDPVFTYQNTVRKFTAVLRTPRKNEKFTKKQYEVFTSPAGGKKSTAFSPSGTKYTYIGGPDNYLRDIADLYKMMYPVYFPLDPGKRDAALLTAAPLLTINLSGIAHDGLAGRSGHSYDITGASLGAVGDGLLFVPETFKVNSLIDSGKASITVRTAEDLKFFANAEGYTITLGGTIIHRHSRVGFYEHASNHIVFMQGVNFPYNTSGRSEFWGPDKAISVGFEGAMEAIAEERCGAATEAVNAHFGLGAESTLSSTGDASSGDAAFWEESFEDQLAALELAEAAACDTTE